jgi:hypothetical protein
MKRMQRITAGVRAVVEPSSLVTKTAVTGLNKIGSAGHSLEELLLRRAYVLTCQALNGEISGDMLHVLARVYRSAGRSEGAAIALRPSLLMAGDHAGASYATSARFHFERRQYPAARQDAQSALHLGCTIGNEVLADLLSAEAHGGPKARIDAMQASAELPELCVGTILSLTTAHNTTGGALVEAKNAQKAKAAAAAARAREATADLPRQRTRNED